MKTGDSIRKKTELRERFMRYALAHAQDGRIPTVAEFRRALGVTNYMLLNCMNELTREGVIYKKSRKEGTFLSADKNKSVIGLVIEQGRENEYVNTPSWLSGFCGEFSHQSDFMLRLIQLPADGDKSALIRRLGLDMLVTTTLSPYRSAPQPEDEKIVYALTGMTENCQTPLPANNVISVDEEYWIREYVRSGVRQGKKSFAIISPRDRIAQVMIDEIQKQGLTWNPECHLTDAKTLKKKLPEIVRQYNIDAVRCTGRYLADFAVAVKKMHGFHPYFPYFGTEDVYRKIKNDYPWLECSFIFEHLDNFYTRLGKICAEKVFEAVRTGRSIPSEKIKINYSEQYKHLLNNPKGENK